MADKRISQLPRVSLAQGDIVPIQRGAGNYGVDLAGYYSGTGGASLIGTLGGITVEAAIGLKADNSALAGKANTTSLAASTGAALIGGDDGASGSLWTTIQGFITYLRSSVGSALVGFLQSGTGAVARTVQAKLREIVTPEDFGAVGDGVADDTAAIALASTKPVLLWPTGTYLVDSIPAPPAGARWFADGKVTIRRRAASTANAILIVSNSDFECEGIVFDGNKGSNSVACHDVIVTASTSEWRNCEFINAKANGGYGNGLTFALSAIGQNDFHLVHGCKAYGNDTDGIAGQNAATVDIQGNVVYGNGGTGINFNNYDPTFTQKLSRSVVDGNIAHHNTLSGIVFGNFIANNNTIAPVYGPANNESSRVILSDNNCYSNGAYGLAAQGLDFCVSGNILEANATGGSSFGGMLINAVNSSVIGNECINNLGYGIDAGGSQFTAVRSNLVHDNVGVGINGGGSTNVSITDNTVFANGGANGRQIDIQRYEADGLGIGFPSPCINVEVSNNYITLTSSQKGIVVSDGVVGAFITDNKFQGAIANNFLILIAADAVVKGNRSTNSIEAVVTAIDGSGNLIVPDIFEMVLTNSTTTITSINYYTGKTVVGAGGIGWVTVTAGGSGYSSAPTPVFTGGGGTGAAATAIIDKNGAVVGVRMTNYGTGYTSAPAMSFTGGGGSGASATATLSVPLLPYRDLEIYSFQAQTINRAGPPVVENKAAANLTMAAHDAARLKSFAGQWNVMGRAA